MAKLHRVDSEISVRSPTRSIPVLSADMDTLSLRNTSSTLLYNAPDSPRGTDTPRRSPGSTLSPRDTDALRQSSVSTFCYDAGTGTVGDLEHTVRRKPRRLPPLPPRRSAASPLVTAGLDPVRVDVDQRPVSHPTTEQRSGIPERAADHPGRSGGRAFGGASTTRAGAARSSTGTFPRGLEGLGRRATA